MTKFGPTKEDIKKITVSEEQPSELTKFQLKQLNLAQSAIEVILERLIEKGIFKDLQEFQYEMRKEVERQRKMLIERMEGDKNGKN